MTPQHHLPADIERTSLSIITKELDEMGLTPQPFPAAGSSESSTPPPTLTTPKICGSPPVRWRPQSGLCTGA